MTTRILLLAALSAALAACVQYEPAPLDPAAERELVAARGLDTAAGTPTSALPAERFPLAPSVDLGDGLTLAEANSLALFHAPGLVAARRGLRLAGAELLRAGLLKNPELFLGPRLTTSAVGLIFPGSLRFEIPIGGELGAEEQRAEAELSAARHQLLDTEARILVDVRVRFIRMAALQARGAILERLLRQSSVALRATRRLVQAGESDRVALGLATLARDDAAQELRDLQSEEREARVQLLMAVGLLADGGLTVIAPGELLTPFELLPRDDARLLRHPRLAALEARYRAGEQGLRLEVARQWPALRLGPEFESDEGHASIGLGLSLSLPLFDANAGGIAVATERRAAGREAWRAALVDLAGKDALARARHDQARAALDAVRTQSLPAAEAAERVLEGQRRSGQTSLIEALATRSAIARARLREVKLRRAVALRSLESLWFSGWLFPAAQTAEGEGAER